MKTKPILVSFMSLALGVAALGGETRERMAIEEQPPTRPQLNTVAVGEATMVEQPWTRDEERKLSVKADDEGRIVAVGFHNTEITDAQLQYVKGLSHLRSIVCLRKAALIDYELSDVKLAQLTGLTSLRNLDIGESAITDAALAHVKAFRHLESLRLASTRIGDKGLMLLNAFGCAPLSRDIPKLKVLNLDKTQVTDRGLQELTKYRLLGSLSLAQTRVTDAGLVHLASLSNLKSLSLFQTQVTDAGLLHLARLQQLESLDLSRTGVTDGGLKELKGLAWRLERRTGPPRLERLWLSGTRITDAGLVHLESFTHLKYLNLHGTSVTREGTRRLRERLPNADIHPPSGAAGSDDDQRRYRPLSEEHSAASFADNVIRQEHHLIPQLRRHETPADVVTSFVADVQALGERYPELSGFRDRDAALQSDLETRYSHRLKTIHEMRGPRPSDLGPNGIDLHFVVRPIDAPVWTEAGLHAVVRFEHLGFDLYSGFVLSPEPTPELHEELDRIFSKHRALLKGLDREVAKQRVAEADAGVGRLRECLSCKPGLPAFAAGPQQMRGVWMHATQIKTRAEADGCVARIHRANLNAVFLLVWYWGGQAYYHSQLCPMGEDVEQGYDPLGHMIAQCHQRGIEVHAWYVNGSYGAAKPLHVLDEHPEWAVQTGGGKLWYDFGKPQVRKFQSDLMIECLQNYDLDGIHFDYIRYGPKVCWCNHCQEEFAARYGLVPLVGEKRSSFPIVAPLSGNPVAGPTTANVLAQFSGGAAAIVTNQLGKGKVLLLNWHACRQMPPPVAETISRAFQECNAARDKVFVVDTAPNRQEYGRQYACDAVTALQGLGYRAELSDEERLAELPKDSLLVMAAVYLIPDETARQIEQFVEAGGILLVIDGPTRSIHKVPLQRVLGMKRAGRYFNRTELILPTGPSDLLPSSDRKIDLEKERSRWQKWAEYRRTGVTELVRDVYRRAKQIKPKAQVTAAVFTPLASAENVFQDWPGWLREGIIDYVIPMAYTADNHALATQLREWKTIDPQLERIVPGLSLFRRSGRGLVTRDTNLILSQRRLCIENGARGNLFFSLHYLNDPLIDVLTSGPHRDKVPAYRPPPRKAPQPADGVLTAAAFNQIKDHVFVHGDRQTYCNMFNNNPHVALGNMDIFLNPDTGQQNINCDLNLSGFNHMVIRTRKPWKYYRVQLNLKASGPDLIMQQGTKPDELKRRFQEVLSEIRQKKDNPTKPSTATE